MHSRWKHGLQRWRASDVPPGLEQRGHPDRLSPLSALKFAMWFRAVGLTSMRFEPSPTAHSFPSHAYMSRVALSQQVGNGTNQRSTYPSNLQPRSRCDSACTAHSPARLPLTDTSPPPGPLPLGDDLDRSFAGSGTVRARPGQAVIRLWGSGAGLLGFEPA
jgi:hypothetical protein